VIIKQVLARGCVPSGLLRPDLNSLGYIQICAFLVMMCPASFSFRFFTVHHVDSVSCACGIGGWNQTNPVSTLGHALALA
jgi:hypothetical protein